MSSVQEKIRNSNFIGVSKELLIIDCYNQLEGVYGLKSDGKFEKLTDLPNLIKGNSDYEIRSQLEDWVGTQILANKTAVEAVKTFVKEYAFTYLNRFVAIKMMEERKLIRQSFSRGYESNNFKFYLADHPEDEALWKQGSVYKAYKNFISHLSSEIAKDAEIRVLFDPNSIYSLLFPQEKTIRDIFDVLNSTDLEPIWGEDELIGWVYQYFIEDEKSAVFAKIYQEKKKLDLRDLPAATQIFTPKWIVKYLVENTLGRLWIRMHPDSELIKQMQYYVPNAQDLTDKQPLKPASQITLLDPACGTMHFGMYAFDLFYEMYSEEIRNAGREGWSTKASVDSPDHIAKSIIEKNIYGIDIDLRAIQLSALSLYLKAKTKNKSVILEKYNITHTNIPTFNEIAINSFLSNLKVQHGITKKLLAQILPLLNKAYYLGSLMKIEEVVESFVDKEKIALKREFQAPDLFGIHKEHEQLGLDLFVEKKVVWKDIRNEIYSSLKLFSESHTDKVNSYYAGETIKGIGLIDALLMRHDVVVANPPFSGKRNWNMTLRSDLQELYSKTAGDLYTCFISRCLELTCENGFTGMITIHSFMFTASYEEIRKNIIERTVVETLCHLGPTFMELSNPYAQQCVMYVLKQSKTKHKNSGVYFRLISYLYEEKERAFLRFLNNYKSSTGTDYYLIEQEKLKIIPSWPFVYWISDGIRSLFSDNDLLYINSNSIARPYKGNITGDNFRFLRYVWEVRPCDIIINCNSREESAKCEQKWYPYMKGGAAIKWYGNRDHLINYKNDGKEIRESGIFGPRNPHIYFLEGLTLSSLTISNLCVRYMPKGCLCDSSGMPVIANHVDLMFLLAVLNSQLVTYLIKLINPTVNYQPNDIARLPIVSIKRNAELSLKILNLANECVKLRESLLKYDETYYGFISPVAFSEYYLNILIIEKLLVLHEIEISDNIFKLYNTNEQDKQAILKEIGGLSKHDYQDKIVSNSEYENAKVFYINKHIPSVATMGDDNELEPADIDNNEDSHEEMNVGKQARYLTYAEICIASKLHPDVVYDLIVSNNLFRPEERTELAVRWVSYVVGIILGRFKHKNVQPDDDGICVLDAGHDDDLPKNVFYALEKCLSPAEALEIVAVIGNNSGEQPVDVLRKFLERDYFTKWHIPMYKKRPVYWLLQTRKKSYGFYIYNQVFTNELLYSLIQKYLEPKIKLENTKLKDCQVKRDSAAGRDKRQYESEINAIEELISDIEEFKQNIQEVISTGFNPDIDDGVILNMALLYKLIPSWKEPKKFYDELKKGKYEWSTISKNVFKKK